jgi:hypothetical protein
MTAADFWIAPALSGAIFRKCTNTAPPARKIFELDL